MDYLIIEGGERGDLDGILNNGGMFALICNVFEERDTWFSVYGVGSGLVTSGLAFEGVQEGNPLLMCVSRASHWVVLPI